MVSKRSLVLASLVVATVALAGIPSDPSMDPVGIVPASPEWYSGLGLTALWECNEGSGTVIVDRVTGVYPVTLVGLGQKANWVSVGPLTALKLGDDTGAAYSGGTIGHGRAPVDTLGMRSTNSLAFGGWFRLNKVLGTTSGKLLGVGNSPLSSGNMYINVLPGGKGVTSTLRPEAVGAVVHTNSTPIGPDDTWHFVAAAYTRATSNSWVIVDDNVSNRQYPNLYAAIPRDAFTAGAPFQFGLGTTSYSHFQMRGVFFKYGGTTNDIVEIYNRTKSRYGR